MPHPAPRPRSPSLRSVPGWVIDVSCPKPAFSSALGYKLLSPLQRSERWHVTYFTRCSYCREKPKEELATIWRHSRSTQQGLVPRLSRTGRLRLGPWEFQRVLSARSCVHAVGPCRAPAGEAVLTVGCRTEGQAMTYETEQRHKLKSADKAKSGKARMIIVPPPLWCLF